MYCKCSKQTNFRPGFDVGKARSFPETFAVHEYVNTPPFLPILTSAGLPSHFLCRSCFPSIRHNSTTASLAESTAVEPFPAYLDQLSSLEKSASHSPRYRIKASVLLSRPPLLTRDLTAFEKAHFLYQKRLNERLALPFSRYFYYQKGTPGDIEWKRKIKERKTPARDIGPYNGYGKEAWNDEVLVGDRISEPTVQIEKLVQDAEVDANGIEGAKKEEIVRPKSRSTEADQNGEKSSLNRLLTRTLYLVVKIRGQDGRWTFPENDLLKDESLHRVCD